MTGAPTIFALATPPGRSGVAVIRVSGAQAAATARQLAGIVPQPRLATLRSLREPGTGALLDRALLLYFENPDSYTGEDVVEYHVHGGRAVIDGVLGALGALTDCRLAEPGEFTRRAFENGKLDLTEAEAVADLIDAETFLQREQALQQMDGVLSRLYQDWADRLAALLAHAEADIDFPDEDLPAGLAAALRPRLETLLREITHHLDDNHRGEILRDGVRIAVLGAPNAGKSSLINALARRDIAIVSPLAGTTRDVIEAHLQIGGYPVIVSDTAGLRVIAETGGHFDIEGEGIRRARVAAENADIRLLVFDASLLPGRDAETAALDDDRSLIVYNKADLAVDLPAGGLGISALHGDGLDALTVQVAAMIADRIGTGRDVALTRRRHREALDHACRELDACINAPLVEMAAENLRRAVRAIGRITGRVDIEDLLDMIFRDFCIGK